jgi:hypothetical protein
VAKLNKPAGDFGVTRALVVIRREADRNLVATWAQKVPVGTRVEMKAPKRSLPQNDRMWAMLTEIAQQVPYHGLKLTADDFKLLFLDALKREVRMVPNLDGNGFVSLGRSSSDLSKDEMSMLLELIAKFGAEHGVVFREPAEEAA